MGDTPPDIPVTLANAFWALGILATVATTAIGATWAMLRHDIERLNRELTTFRGAKDWKLPETLESLNEVSTKLRLELSERKEFERLQKANGELTEEIEAKSLTLQRSEIRVSELEKALTAAQTPVTDFELSAGETQMLIKPHLIMGVNNISSLNTVDIIISNDSFDLGVGAQRPVKHEGRTYLLTLRRINRIQNPYTAKFSFAPMS